MSTSTPEPGAPSAGGAAHRRAPVAGPDRTASVADPGPAVIVVTGVMAAGKSTVAQRLAERLPRSVHVRGDVFRRMIVSGREEMTPLASAEAQRQLRLRYELAGRTADAYAAAGFTTVVQDLLMGHDLTTFLARVTAPARYLVVLAPSVEVVEAREAGRAKRGYGTFTARGFDAELRRTTPRVGLWLDTSPLTVETTVARILSRLDDARVPRTFATERELGRR